MAYICGRQSNPPAHSDPMLYKVHYFHIDTLEHQHIEQLLASCADDEEDSDDDDGSVSSSASLSGDFSIHELILRSDKDKHNNRVHIFMYGRAGEGKDRRARTGRPGRGVGNLKSTNSARASRTKVIDVTVAKSNSAFTQNPALIGIV